MVQPKYSPEEALQRVKLMMGYDLKKTLKENVKEIGVVLNEQDVTTTNVNTIKDELNAFFNTDEQKIVDIIKTYKTKDAFNKLLASYKQITGKELGDAFGCSFTPGSDVDEWKQLSDHLKPMGITISGTSAYNGNGCKTVFIGSASGGGDVPKVVTGGGVKSSYTPCTGTYQYGCMSNIIAKVQGCLKLGTDGKFGPKTKAALAAKGFTTFTDADVDKICATTTVTTPEVGGEKNVVDANGEF